MSENAAERIPITNDYMFGYVMRQPGICAKMLECLLPGIHIKNVRFKDAPQQADTQKTIQSTFDAKSVRLDVYLDDGQTVYNVEMQTGHKSNLPKRVRYYSSLIDCDQLEKSHDYNELRPTYVIFICTYDPFGKDRYRYFFERTCREEEHMALNDESYCVFFNTTGHKGDISEELKNLLEYFRNPKDIPEHSETELIQEIDRLVDYANQDSDWRRGYMTFQQAQMDAKAEGIEIGMAQGRAQGITIGEIRQLKSLVQKGIVTVELASREANMSVSDFKALLKS